MLLAVDIGNTTIALGVFKGKTFVADWRIKTDKDKTGDEYGVVLLSLFRRAGIRPDRINRRHHLERRPAPDAGLSGA